MVFWGSSIRFHQKCQETTQKCPKVKQRCTAISRTRFRRDGTDGHEQELFDEQTVQHENVTTNSDSLIINVKM